MHFFIKFCLFFVLTLAPAFCKDAIDLDALKNQLPGEIEIPESLQNVTLPTVDEAKELFREKCIKVSGSDAAFEEAEQATGQMMECLTNLVNVTLLKEEIEIARPTGDLDTVFSKYCNKKGIALECVHNFTNSVEPCLEPEEFQQKTVLTKIIQDLLKFVCYKDGNHIALFIAEKGPECFESKKEVIQECLNSTFLGYISTETLSLATLPKLVFGEKECADVDSLEHCIAKELKKCSESTPLNLVESLFKYVRTESPCANFTSKPVQKTKTVKVEPNFGQSNRFSVEVLVGAFVFAMIYKVTNMF